MISILLNFFYPIFCLICDKRGEWICATCESHIKPALPECYRCRRISSGYVTHSLCRGDDDFTSVIPLWKYNRIAREIMSSFKFKSLTDIEGSLGYLVSRRLSQIEGIEQILIDATLLPIPLHRKRLNERGFNQADLICNIVREFASKHHNLKIEKLQLINKAKESKQQSRSTLDERATNLHSSFRMNDQFNLREIKKIIVIDDVITTSATVMEIRDTLYNAYREESIPTPELHCIALFRGRPYFRKKNASNIAGRGEKIVPPRQTNDYSTISAS